MSRQTDREAARSLADHSLKVLKEFDVSDSTANERTLHIALVWTNDAIRILLKDEAL